MSSPMYQVSVTFHDVAACFSAEEWGCLEDWQKELYKNVMREIHTALQAMGFEIINPDVLFRIKKVKDDYTNICDLGGSVSRAAFHPEDPEHLMGIKQERGSHMDPCRRKSTRACQPAARNPDILLRIKQGDHSAISEFSENSSTLSPGEPILTSVFSLQMEKEKVEELNPAHRPNSRITKSHKRFPSQPIKQEEDYVKVSVGGTALDRSMVSPQERFPSQPVKQEEVDYEKASVGGATQDNAAFIHQNSNLSLRSSEMEEFWVNQPEERDTQDGGNQEFGQEDLEQSDLPEADYILNGSLYKWSGWHSRVGILSPLPQHRRDRPYQCNECSKTFSDLSRFLRHQIGHAGGRPYHCHHCVKTFRQPYELMVHQRVHTGEKPYQCTVCGKKFIKNSILKVHQRIHTGERPYKCTLCSKSFVQSHHLKTHQKTHTGGRLQNY